MGRVWSFGDDVDTDVITPTKYINSRDQYVAHTLEPIEPDFADEVEPGDVIVAGSNFGCGSSRETAAIAFLDHEVEAIVAESFARIFYRNAINIGLPVYICPEASQVISDGDDVAIDHEDAVISNRTTGEEIAAEPHPEFIQKILDVGGLKNYNQVESE
jgi:3-isopropylmalate/(R)-2-methylmalate dehydratase small subunit